ncbi:MAG TPA: NAD-dependent epimerase/dehydratase family protein [Kofleriaceae bacterium]
MSHRIAVVKRETIVIAGATGFVGHAVAARLAERFDVVGLTRGRTDQEGAWNRLVACDLFSLKDVEQAVEGATYVAYLVHSMLPSARLVQGSFADLDLICADNMGRAAAKAGVKQIVYLGGLMPPESDHDISKHLESRREVERALGAHGTPVTTLRAGMVVGPHGSSFEILTKLVDHLPAMLLPAWTEHRCQPIDLDSVAALVDYCAGRASTLNQTYDIGGPDILRYRDMIAIVGEVMRGKARPALPVPFMTPRLSRLWVSLVTGAPKALVKPLIESLRHDMLARDRRLQDAAGIPGVSFRDAVSRALLAQRSDDATPHAYKRAPRTRATGVRSVQRVHLPQGATAEWAAHEYMRWLPHGAWPPVRVEVDENDRDARFYLVGTHEPLLELRFASDRSGKDRQLFYVTGGVLAKKTVRGRLEFRATPAGDELLTAIHEFEPRLPWFIYRWTQALFHAWVMARFGRHLAETKLPVVRLASDVVRDGASVARGADDHRGRHHGQRDQR